MDPRECLPVDLLRQSPVITRMSSGWSGAGVYRVDAGSRALVLKVSGPGAPLGEWRRQVAILRTAAGAGVAPAIVHVDEERRAVLTVFVEDRSFPLRYGDPRTRAEALALLGRTVRTVHRLPVPAGAPARDGRAFLASSWASLEGPTPRQVAATVDRVLREPPPVPLDPVLSHDDLNPTNLAWDGERLVLLDWDTAGPNDPRYDLATIAMFLRMDPASTSALLAAYGAPSWDLAYWRRLVAALAGTAFLGLARQAGHPGASAAEGAPSLAECYGQLRAGTLDVATPEGRWAFGLALVAEAR